MSNADKNITCGVYKDSRSEKEGCKLNSPEGSDFYQPMILRQVAAAPPLRVNRDFTALSGFTSDELGVGDLFSWIHPEDHSLLEEILEAGEGHAQARHRTKGGSWQLLSWRVKAQDGQVVLLGTANHKPIGDLSRREGEQSLFNETLTITLEAMVHVVESKNPGLRCSILLIDSDQEHVSVGAGPSLPGEYNAAVQGLRIGPAVGSCGTAAFWNVPVVVENIAEDPLWKDLRDEAEIAKVCACWSVPVTAVNNSILGAMALYDVKPGAPTRHQMDVLETSARMVGLAIERDRLEMQLREATKMEALGVLAGGVAHDFNNLLSAVIGNAELAMRKVSEDAPVMRHLEQIINASVTATDLCNQMLAFTGRGVSTTEKFNCNEMVQQTGELLQVAISKKVNLQYELHGAPLGVEADKSQLRQVLMNLITNASESYCNETGIVLVGTSVHNYTGKQLIQLHPDAALEPGDYIRIWVTDSGIGMGPEDMAKIFDPFFTSKPGGRGLGLAAVQGIVRAHGGAISVDSMPGEGTTFAMILPLTPLEIGEQPLASQEVLAAKPARILIGEDEPLVRDVLVMAIEQAGYDVIEAVDGQQVVDVFRSNFESIDCVLLDFNMPKLEGEEVFAELRKIQPGVRVVLCSGFTEHEILNRFEGAGIAGFVQKPARLDVLLSKIDEVIENSGP